MDLEYCKHVGSFSGAARPFPPVILSGALEKPYRHGADGRGVEIPREGLRGTCRFREFSPWGVPDTASSVPVLSRISAGGISFCKGRCFRRYWKLVVEAVSCDRHVRPRLHRANSLICHVFSIHSRGVSTPRFRFSWVLMESRRSAQHDRGLDTTRGCLRNAL